MLLKITENCFDSPQKVPVFPQRSNAARVRNMARLNDGKLPENSKHSFKKSKDKPLPETEALNVEYLWKRSYLTPSDFIASYMYFVLSVYISYNAFFRTSLRKALWDWQLDVT